MKFKIQVVGFNGVIPKMDQQMRQLFGAERQTGGWFIESTLDDWHSKWTGPYQVHRITPEHQKGENSLIGTADLLIFITQYNTFSCR